MSPVSILPNSVFNIHFNIIFLFTTAPKQSYPTSSKRGICFVSSPNISPVVTICTTKFNVKEILRYAHRVCLCVLLNLRNNSHHFLPMDFNTQGVCSLSGTNWNFECSWGQHRFLRYGARAWAFSRQSLTAEAWVRCQVSVWDLWWTKLYCNCTYWAHLVTVLIGHTS